MVSETEGSSVVLVLQRTTHRILQALATSLADLDLTASEINALANLADGEERSVRQLGLATGTPPTTLTGILDRLERRGHVTRELDAADRRSFRVALTDSGRRVAGKVRAAVSDLEEAALAGISARQVAGYHAVLEALQEVS